MKNCTFDEGKIYDKYFILSMRFAASSEYPEKFNKCSSQYHEDLNKCKKEFGLHRKWTEYNEACSSNGRKFMSWLDFKAKEQLDHPNFTQDLIEHKEFLEDTIHSLCMQKTCKRRQVGHRQVIDAHDNARFFVTAMKEIQLQDEDTDNQIVTLLKLLHELEREAGKLGLQLGEEVIDSDDFDNQEDFQKHLRMTLGICESRYRRHLRESLEENHEGTEEEESHEGTEEEEKEGSVEDEEKKPKEESDFYHDEMECKEEVGKMKRKCRDEKQGGKQPEKQQRTHEHPHDTKLENPIRNMTMHELLANRRAEKALAEQEKKEEEKARIDTREEKMFCKPLETFSLNLPLKPSPNFITCFYFTLSLPDSSCMYI